MPFGRAAIRHALAVLRKVSHTLPPAALQMCNNSATVSTEPPPAPCRIAAGSDRGLPAALQPAASGDGSTPCAADQQGCGFAAAGVRVEQCGTRPVATGPLLATASPCGHHSTGLVAGIFPCLAHQRAKKASDPESQGLRHASTSCSIDCWAGKWASSVAACLQ